MQPDSRELEKITALTLQYYDHHAQDFRAGTQAHDVSQNIAALLQSIAGNPAFTILALGCGPGRDLKTLAELGHRAIGLDGAAQFVEMARAYSGCEVWQQDFLNLDLPREFFDGVFANAALFHVPSQKLHATLLQLRTA